MSGPLAEWIVEHGIGETRAALVADGAILEAQVETPGLRAGTVARARLTQIIAAGRVGLVKLEGGNEAMLQPLPAKLTEGAMSVVEIMREAIGHKRPTARLTDRPARPGPDLATRVAADGLTVRILAPHEADALEAAGWSELIEEATTGVSTFAGGALLTSLTPAMTLIDVDGTLAPEALSVAGAGAAAQAIRRLGVTGSIGVDLPTTPGREARAAAAAAVDAALPQPFERTAVNGFGFLQIVRPQARASLPQVIAADPVGAAARALLRTAERSRGAGPRTLSAHPSVIARLDAEPDWIAALGRRLGVGIVLRGVAGLAIFGGHVDALHP